MVKCCAKYSARDLSTVCEFQRMTRGADGQGGFSETWAAISGAPTRCAFRALSGSERWQAQRTESITRNRIAVRYVTGLKDADRVVIDGEAYQITFINNLDRANRWLEIDISGGVPS